MAQSLGHHPKRLHATAAISASDVLQDVTSYLTAAASDPSLHPNAMLTESGPVAVSHGDSFGLALHNLQRIQSGLRGERLIPDPTLHSIVPGVRKRKGQLKNVAAASDSEDQQGWQDRGEFDREQEISDGHLEGTAPPVVREESLGQRTNQDPGSSDAVTGSSPSSSKRKAKAREQSAMAGQDDAERKALRRKMKRERNKAEKRAKAEQKNSKAG